MVTQITQNHGRWQTRTACTDHPNLRWAERLPSGASSLSPKNTALQNELTNNIPAAYFRLDALQVF